MMTYRDLLLSEKNGDDNFIKDNIGEIKNAIGNNSLTSTLENNKILFNSYLEDDNYKMVIKFSSSFLTEEFVKSHFEKIKEAIGNDIVPYTLQDNYELFNSYLEDDNYKMLLNFSKALLTEEFIKSHFEKIKDAIGNYMPYGLRENHTLFNLYVGEENYEILLQFS